ncbi:hypothetical protein A0H81_09675 [Grifola frondosa]|uniref:Uncharacterized protein n=1 Tax=Grifola frondosa TaxID=5627 RepID=A0A1C7LZP5_GRIFR|nr:hypothetical protein A0H81_09675 [Grifola frondosa]
MSAALHSTVALCFSGLPIILLPPAAFSDVISAHVCSCTLLHTLLNLTAQTQSGLVPRPKGRRRSCCGSPLDASSNFNSSTSHPIRTSRAALPMRRTHAHVARGEPPMSAHTGIPVRFAEAVLHFALCVCVCCFSARLVQIGVGCYLAASMTGRRRTLLDQRTASGGNATHPIPPH